jgi:hypothetical protein
MGIGHRIPSRGHILLKARMQSNSALFSTPEFTHFCEEFNRAAAHARFRKSQAPGPAGGAMGA